MREIKFRALLTDGSVIYFGYEGYLEEYNLTIKRETIGQYTGLKDKNGKEIYESDIVTHHRERDGEITDKVKGEVYYKDGCFWVNSELFDANGVYQPRLANLISKFKPEENSCEVIGNIHENPDLLKQ